MALRGLMLLFVLLLVFLAIDAARFDGQYRRDVWRQASREYQMLQYKAVRSVDISYF